MNQMHTLRQLERTIQNISRRCGRGDIAVRREWWSSLVHDRASSQLGVIPESHPTPLYLPTTTSNTLCKRWGRRYRLALLLPGVGTYFRGVGGHCGAVRVFEAALVPNQELFDSILCLNWLESIRLTSQSQWLVAMCRSEPGTSHQRVSRLARVLWYHKLLPKNRNLEMH
jgi:hypothetical protein